MVSPSARVPAEGFSPPPEARAVFLTAFVFGDLFPSLLQPNAVITLNAFKQAEVGRSVLYSYCRVGGADDNPEWEAKVTVTRPGLADVRETSGISSSKAVAKES